MHNILHKMTMLKHVFRDESVHFAIQKGVQVSKSKTVWFKHNDMHDLEQKILEVMHKREASCFPF